MGHDRHDRLGPCGCSGAPTESHSGLQHQEAAILLREHLQAHPAATRHPRALRLGNGCARMVPHAGVLSVRGAVFVTLRLLRPAPLTALPLDHPLVLIRLAVATAVTVAEILKNSELAIVMSECAAASRTRIAIRMLSLRFPGCRLPVKWPYLLRPSIYFPVCSPFPRNLDFHLGAVCRGEPGPQSGAYLEAKGTCATRVPPPFWLSHSLFIY